VDHLPLIAQYYAWLLSWFALAMIQGLALWPGAKSAGESAAPSWPNPELAAFLSITAGLAAQIVILIVLASLHLLSPGPVFSVLGVFTLICMISLRRNPARQTEIIAVFRLPFTEWLRILPIVLLILPWALRPLDAPGGSDSLTYHLPYAKFYLENGGLAVNEALRFPLHTHSVNLLYAVGMIRPGATVPQLLHAGMGWLALLGVYGMARHWNGWLTAVLAVASVLLFKEFQLSFQYAFVDNGLTLFVTAAFLALALWTERRQPSYLWMAAVFAGTAMGIKYHGALFTVPLGLMVLWYSRDLGLTVRFALLTSVFGLFWYVRSWSISGNPVDPFAGNLFGHYLWTADELAGVMNELKSHGIERNLPNFLELPEKMFSERAKFNGATGKGGVLVGVFLASLLSLPWQKSIVRALQLVTLAWLAFWFWTSQVVRYLFPVLPLMGLVAWTAWGRIVSGSFAPLVKRNPGIDGATGRFLQDAFLLPLILVSTLVFGLRALDEELSYPRLTPEQQSTFLRAWQPAYQLMEEAAADGRVGDGPLLQFRLQEAKYFYPGKVCGDWMGPYAYHRYGYVGPNNLWVINDPATLYRQVTQEGFTAVAVRKDTTLQFAPMDLDRYRDYFEFISETDYGVVMIPRPDAPR
jgi:hypothetical protein